MSAVTGPPDAPAVAAVLASEQPYTARSVLASTLLGTDPPELPARVLVRVGELFEIPEGTVRVAISRMTATGELVAGDGAYRLAGRLLDRQERQAAGRHGEPRDWSGDWRLEVVDSDGPRSAAIRAELRAAATSLHLAEWRAGLWLRPDNLPTDPANAAEQAVRSQCQRLHATPDRDPAELAARLWDLRSWARRARLLRDALGELLVPLDDGDTRALPAGFVVAAATLRHLVADPLLPPQLHPADWPGDALRADYERYDRAFTTTWRQAFRAPG